MILVRGLVESSPSEEVLLTGSGDGTVKQWRLSKDEPLVQEAELPNGNDAVLSIAVEGPLLYCGLSGGALNIWNLDSHQLVKRITQHTGDVWAIDIIKGIAISGDSNGVVKVNTRYPTNISQNHRLLTPRFFGDSNSIPSSRKSNHGSHTKEPSWRLLPVFFKTGASMPREEMTTA
jgi:WD40 repeat protein